MARDSRVLDLAFRAGVVGFVTAEFAVVDEEAARVFADFLHDLIFSRIDPEATADDQRWLSVFLQFGQQISERRAVLSFGVVGFRRGCVLANCDDDEISFERQLVLQAIAQIKVALSSFEVGDVLDHHGRLATRGFGNPVHQQMDEVLLASTRRHAPVPGPADVRSGTVQRDAVPQEQNLANSLIANAQRRIVRGCGRFVG